MISECLPEDKRRLHELELQLSELEKDNPRIQVSDVAIGLQEMNYRLDELDRLAQKEPKGRREDYRRRVQHMRTAHAHIKSSLDSLVRRRDQESHQSQRQELFVGAIPDNSVSIDLELAESGSLDRSGRMLNDYIATGQETLTELISQRERLKGVQRKVFDILNYLGISNSIMRSVERRDFVDKWIVFVGMALILGLIFFVWTYFRRK